ncbi:MAG: hypothetical protein RIT81_46420 [Deltaproteobacteria bacterium]
MTSASELAASPLDRISAIMDSTVRPLDGGLILTLREVPSLEALERGAASAREVYPVSRCVLDDRTWRRVDDPPAIATGDDVQAFLDAGAPVRETPSPRQLLAENRLVTVGHHAAGDLVSILAWVRHQLDVAFGRDPAPPSSLELKGCDQAVRKSKYAWSGASTRLWSRGDPSNVRRRKKLHVTPFSPRGDVTYNDVLLTATLDTFAAFNAARGASAEQIAVWCPVNVRARPFDGFGNGSSRVRIYRRYDDDTPIAERVARVREQVRWTKKNGEWFVPVDHPLLSGPAWLLRLYLSRPWVDMATGAFSHGERVGPGDDDTLWPEVEDLEIVGQLDRRHPFGIFGATFRGLTRLTLLYDPGQLEGEDVDALADIFTERLDAARAALT